MDKLPTDTEAVIHAAALRAPMAGQDLSSLMEINVEGTRRIVRLAEAAGCERICYISTQAVYGSTGAPWTEEAGLDPETPYAVSKREGEREILQWKRKSASILRVSRVYGVTPFTRWSELPGLFSSAVAHGRPLEIHGTGEQRFDLVHVCDAVRAVVQVALAPNMRGPRIYNVGGDGSVSLNELAEIFSVVAQGVGLPDVKICRKPGYALENDRYLELDVSKIRAELGWMPHISLQEGVSEYLACV